MYSFLGDDEGEDNEYSDDDDMSWKVRRAAAKCLEAIISTRRDLISDMYRLVSPPLIARFKGERFKRKDLKNNSFCVQAKIISQTMLIFPLFTSLVDNLLLSYQRP